MAQQYLIIKHPIRCYGDTSPISIPTCPYKWPNGQGDVAKFLQGEKNSHDWAREYGWIYRIWSGMTPEMLVILVFFPFSQLHIWLEHDRLLTKAEYL